MSVGAAADPVALVRKILPDGPDPEEGREEWAVQGRSPRAVAFPADTGQAAELLAAASRSRFRVALLGAGTCLRVGPAPGAFDLAVSTRQMDRIVHYEPADLTITAGAGVLLTKLGEITGDEGQWLPVDPPGLPGTLGGLVATGPDGFLSARYGRVRDLVLGLTVVTADGRVLRPGGRVVKNVAGFDLVRLITGSWGGLGLVTEATVRLYPVPADQRVLRAHGPTVESLLPVAAVAARARFLPAAVFLREWGRSGGGREARLEVRLQGSSSAVRSQARQLMEQAEELEEVDVGGAGKGRGPTMGLPYRPGASAELDPDLVVRMRLPAGDLPGLLAVARSLGRVEGSRDALEGSRVGLEVDALAGWVRVWAIHLRTDGPWGRRWALRLQDLRRTLEERGGGLSVEVGPPSILDGVGPAPRSGPVVERLMREIRRRFDPGEMLLPGRFPFDGAQAVPTTRS